MAHEGRRSEAMRKLLELKDDAGLTPLHLACAAGQTGVVQFLLQCGSDPCTVDWLAGAPLHAAVEQGHAGAALYRSDEVRGAESSPGKNIDEVQNRLVQWIFQNRLVENFVHQLLSLHDICSHFFYLSRPTHFFKK